MKARVVCPDAVGGGTHSHAGGTCWIGVSGKQEVAGRKVLGMSIRQTVFGVTKILPKPAKESLVPCPLRNYFIYPDESALRLPGEAAVECGENDELP